MEHAFLTEQSRKLRKINKSHWLAAREFLTFFDTIRFCRYLALLDERTKSKCKIKNERLLASLRLDRFGNALSDTTRHVLNLPDYVLSNTESFVLSHGLNFGLWRDGVVVRASASQSVDLGFISLVESYQKTLKNGIHSFPAWRSAFRKGCGEQAGKFACCVLGQGT